MDGLLGLGFMGRCSWGTSGNPHLNTASIVPQHDCCHESKNSARAISQVIYQLHTDIPPALWFTKPAPWQPKQRDSHHVKDVCAKKAADFCLDDSKEESKKAFVCVFLLVRVLGFDEGNGNYGPRRPVQDVYRDGSALTIANEHSAIALSKRSHSHASLFLLAPLSHALSAHKLITTHYPIALSHLAAMYSVHSLSYRPIILAPSPPSYEGASKLRRVNSTV
eukprot:1178174-Prorocentrum_minimum.AAC.2